jgi:SPOR domain
MFVKERRSVLRSWVPALFATFWVILAGFSGAYLYSLIGQPPAPPAVSAPAPQASAGKTEDEPNAAAILNADQAQQKALAAVQDQVDHLRQKLASVDTRLKPIEKLLGPVATMPASSPGPVTTSPPTPAAPEKSAEASAPSSAPPPAAPPPESASASPTKPADETPPLPPVPPTMQPKQAENESDQTNSASSNDTGAPTATASVNTPSPPPAPPASPPEPALQLPPGTNRFGIEIGSVSDESALKPMWRDLLQNHAALVAGLEARRVMAPDKQWRLVAGPFSSVREATEACALFKKVQLPCQPTVFAGTSL